MARIRSLASIIQSTTVFTKSQYGSNKISNLEVVPQPHLSQITFRATVKSMESFTHYPVTIKVVTEFSKDNDLGATKEFPFLTGSRQSPKFSKIPIDTSNAVIKCSCQAHRFSYEYYNSKAGVNIGRPRGYKRKTTTRPEVNPHHTPGMCKHITTVCQHLEKSKLIKFSPTSSRIINTKRKKINY
jgi:hypothetical protein